MRKILTLPWTQDEIAALVFLGAVVLLALAVGLIRYLTRDLKRDEVSLPPRLLAEHKRAAWVDQPMGRMPTRSRKVLASKLEKHRGSPGDAA